MAFASDLWAENVISEYESGIALTSKWGNMIIDFFWQQLHNFDLDGKVASTKHFVTTSIYWKKCSMIV